MSIVGVIPAVSSLKLVPLGNVVTIFCRPTIMSEVEGMSSVGRELRERS